MRNPFEGRLFDEPVGDPGAGSGDPVAPAAFDPTKFRTEFKAELLGEIRKDLNGIDKKFKNEFKSNFDSLKTDIQSWLNPGAGHGAPNPNPNPDDPGNPNPNPDPAVKPPEPKQDPQVLALLRQVKELQQLDKQRQIEADQRAKEAEHKEVEALTRTAIANHKFNSDRGPKDLFALVRSDIKRGDDGNLYGPEGMTLEEYIAKEYNERPFLHPAKSVNGSGAGPSNGGSPSYGGKPLDRDNIRPNMTPEEVLEFGKAISSAIGGRR